MPSHRSGEVAPANAVLQTKPPGDASWTQAASPDNRGDGFPPGARLDDAQDREHFTRWITFLAESHYYRASPRALGEIRDCAGLIRYAYRNALVAHTPAWRRLAGLPYEPGFGDIAKFEYPKWPLGRGLFRTRPGPFAPSDIERGVFGEFADSATLLHYNSFLVSRDVRAARPGDLLFFHQPIQREPHHVMLFVGRSYFQPEGSNWIVYHTGDLSGRVGEIREVQAGLLTEHPDPRWRPLAVNPHFLGVYRFEILR